MMRLLLRVFALAIIVALAVGSAASATQAAEGDYSKVPRSRLTERPFRSIALVTVGDRVVCTGFIVDRRKIVTAAHCLVQDAGNGKFKLKIGLPGRLRVYRGYSKAAGGTVYRSCPVSRAWAHPKFVKSGKGDSLSGSRVHDYAVLTVPASCQFPQNSVMRLWANEWGDGQLNVGQRVRTAGYPADPRFKGMTGLNLWRTEGRVRPLQSSSRHLIFTGFVASGMSGGPVWRVYNENSPCGRTHCVVGIVTECAINSRGLCKRGLSERVAVRMTPQVKKQIKQH